MAGESRSTPVHLVVSALARGLSIKQAAAESGVSERTVARLSVRDDVKKDIRKFRDQMNNRTTGKLSHACIRAVAKLTRLADEGAPAVQLNACKAILEYNVKFVETSELRERIADLEARVDKSESEDLEVRLDDSGLESEEED